MNARVGKVATGNDANALSKHEGDFWERFWFLPTDPSVLSPVRIGLAAVVVLYCVSWFGELTSWYASDGVFPVDRLGRLVMATGIESMAAWQASLLYWIQSPVVLLLFVVLLCGAALAMGMGLGGRWMIAAVWIACISMANRAWLLVGPGEFALTTALACLWIGGSGSSTNGTYAGAWTGLSRRLIQVHLALMLVFVCVVQLIRGISSANDGVAYEGIARMVAVNPWLGPKYAGWFLGSSLGTVLGVVLTVTPLICLPALAFRLTSSRLPLFALIACFVLAGILSGYWVLVTTWIAMAFAFAPRGTAAYLNSH